MFPFLFIERVSEPDPTGLVVLAFFLLFPWIAFFGIFGSYISNQKGRGGAEGFWFAVLMGPFGLLLLTQMPNLIEQSASARFQSPAPASRTSSLSAAKEVDASHRQQQRDQIAREAQAEAARMMRQQQTAEWIDYIFTGGWYAKWPEWVRLVVVCAVIFGSLGGVLFAIVNASRG